MNTMTSKKTKVIPKSYITLNINFCSKIDFLNTTHELHRNVKLSDCKKSYLKITVNSVITHVNLQDQDQ